MPLFTEIRRGRLCSLSLWLVHPLTVAFALGIMLCPYGPGVKPLTRTCSWMPTPAGAYRGIGVCVWGGPQSSPPHGAHLPVASGDDAAESPVHMRAVTVGRFPRRLWGQACASPNFLLLFDPHSPIVTGLHLRWWIWVLILAPPRGNLTTKHKSPSPSLLPLGVKWG